MTVTKISRVLLECVNVRDAERKIRGLQVRLKEIDAQLQVETDTATRVHLEGEWVEAHMHILNFRHLVGMKLDAVIEQMYLGQQGSQADACH